MARSCLTAFFLMAMCLAQALSGMNSAAQAQEKKEISVSKDILKKYVGTYQLSASSNMIISLDGKKLEAQVSGAGKLPLVATSETKFFPKGVDAEIEFFKDEQGEVPYLLFRQGGREIKGMRISQDAELEMKVSPDILKKYAGVYRLHHGYDIEIYFSGGQLYQKVAKKGPFGPGEDYRLVAISETKFMRKQAAPTTGRVIPRQDTSELEFVRGNTGQATELILHQGPMMQLKFHRIGDKPVEEKGIDISPEILAKYVGTYFVMHPPTGSDIVMNITLKGDHLNSQTSGQNSVRLLAESESKFFTDSGEIEFFKDDKGVASYLTNLQMGMKQTLPRIGEGWEMKEATVSPETLAKYIGMYQFNPGPKAVISMKNGRLATQIPGQPEFLMYAQSDSRFFLKEVPVLIQFVTDEKGAVTEMINHQNGTDMKATRINN